MSVLKITDLTKNFGGLTAVSNVNMELLEGELIGLIGPNGAGKTTLFNLLTGVYERSEGKIEVNVNNKMVDISTKKPYTITSLGLARTFQNIRLFKDLSVIENVKVGMNKDSKCGFLASILRLNSYYKEEKAMDDKANELLKIVNLDKSKNLLAKNLPYGEQRKLEIARALATNPKILFLDEPAAGMNPQETLELTSLISKLKKEFNLTIVLIEHDMSLVMEICERIYVLDYGKLIATGTPNEIVNNKRVIEAYLGED